MAKQSSLFGFFGAPKAAQLVADDQDDAKALVKAPAEAKAQAKAKASNLSFWRGASPPSTSVDQNQNKIDPPTWGGREIEIESANQEEPHTIQEDHTLSEEVEVEKELPEDGDHDHDHDSSSLPPFSPRSPPLTSTRCNPRASSRFTITTTTFPPRADRPPGTSSVSPNKPDEQTHHQPEAEDPPALPGVVRILV